MEKLDEMQTLWAEKLLSMGEWETIQTWGGDNVTVTVNSTLDRGKM